MYYNLIYIYFFFSHIARCILDPNFSSLDQKDSSQLYQLIQLGDQTRKKYGSFSKPVNDGSKSSADMAFVGREFTYLLVLLKHQWQHPIVKYMLLGSGQGNIDTAAGIVSSLNALTMQADILLLADTGSVYSEYT